MHVCATLSSTATRLQEEVTKNKMSKEKSHKVVMFHVCMVGALIQPIAMDGCTFV
jgi:hypothetical protein